MVTRIHPEIDVAPEYDPFKDEKIFDLGPNENMSVRQALTVAYNTGFLNVVVVGECSCGCGLIKILSSSMSNSEMLMLAEKLKLAVIDRELYTHESDGDNPEEAG